MQKQVFSFDAIGTTWRISLESSFPQEKLETILREVHKRIESFDKTYSRFRDDSLVTKISQHKGVYIFPDDAKALFSLYQKLYELTEGLFTPMIGNLLADAGYDAQYSLKSKDLHQVPSMEDSMDFNYPKVTIKKPVLLDYGAAGKGYLVDLVGEILKKNNIDSFCINAGGDILYKNTNGKSLRVGLEDPRDTQKIVGIAEIVNQSICGSAINRRTWGKYNHVMNPETKKSIKNIIATWVIAETGLLADGLTTALFFKPATIFLPHFNFEYAILSDDFSLETSKDFPAEIY